MVMKINVAILYYIVINNCGVAAICLLSPNIDRLLAGRPLVCKHDEIPTPRASLPGLEFTRPLS